MSSLVLFKHCGLWGAVPAAQAQAVAAVSTAHEKGRLWPGVARESGREMYMRAEGALVGVMCEQITLRDVRRSELLALSPTLRGALADLPHVVGIAFLDEGPAWLVDMTRYRRPRS